MSEGSIDAERKLYQASKAGYMRQKSLMKQQGGALTPNMFTALGGVTLHTKAQLITPTLEPVSLTRGIDGTNPINVLLDATNTPRIALFCKQIFNTTADYYNIRDCFVAHIIARVCNVLHIDSIPTLRLIYGTYHKPPSSAVNLIGYGQDWADAITVNADPGVYEVQLSVIMGAPALKIRDLINIEANAAMLLTWINVLSAKYPQKKADGSDDINAMRQRLQRFVGQHMDMEAYIKFIFSAYLFNLWDVAARNVVFTITYVNGTIKFIPRWIDVVDKTLIGMQKLRTSEDFHGIDLAVIDTPTMLASTFLQQLVTVDPEQIISESFADFPANNASKAVNDQAYTKWYIENLGLRYSLLKYKVTLQDVLLVKQFGPEVGGTHIEPMTTIPCMKAFTDVRALLLSKLYRFQNAIRKVMNGSVVETSLQEIFYALSDPDVHDEPFNKEDLAINYRKCPVNSHA